MTSDLDKKNIDFQLNFHLEFVDDISGKYNPTIKEFTSTLTYLNHIIGKTIKEVSESDIYEWLKEDNHNFDDVALKKISSDLKNQFKKAKDTTRIKYIESLSSFVIFLEIIDVALSFISSGLDLREFWKNFKRKVHRTTEDLLNTDITGNYQLDSTLARRLNINLFFSSQDEIQLKVGYSWINHGIFTLPKSECNFFPAPNSKIYILNNKSSKVDYIEGRIKVYESRNLIFNRLEKKKLEKIIPDLRKGENITIHKLSENVFQFRK